MMDLACPKRWYQFSVTNADRRLRFGGRGAATILFDSATHSIIVEVPVAITQIHAENGLTASRVRTEVWMGIADGGVTSSKLAKEVRESISKGVSAYESFPISQENISSKVEFARVENADGKYKFSITNENRGLRFKGTGAVSISFDPTTHMITIHAEPAVYNYYTTNYYTTNNYYGPRLSDVSGQPRVEYIGAGEGLEQYKVGDVVGYYKIKEVVGKYFKYSTEETTVAGNTCAPAGSLHKIPDFPLVFGGSFFGGGVVINYWRDATSWKPYICNPFPYSQKVYHTYLSAGVIPKSTIILSPAWVMEPLPSPKLKMWSKHHMSYQLTDSTKKLSLLSLIHVERIFLSIPSGLSNNPGF
jgi:hypothetical protein